MAKMGRPAKIQADDATQLVAIVESDRTATLSEVRHEFKRRTGIDVHEQTIVKTLRKLGIQRVPSEQAVCVERKPNARRYGYTKAHRRHEPEQDYSSCLTDAEWALVRDLFENPGGRGLPPTISRRKLVDACCYVVRTGCSWRMLPSDFPRWQNVYRTFRRWSEQGKFEQMHDRLRALWRERAKRNDEPTAAVLDSQSTRGSPQGGDTGFDAGKKVKGRKRHLVVDTLGLLLAVSVTAASVQDRDGAYPVVSKMMAKHPTIKTLFVDSAYAGQCAQLISHCHNIRAQVVRHPANRNVGRWVNDKQADLFTVEADAQGFVVQPKRWVVERSHAWIERSRRLIMHHDRLSQVAETWVWLAGARFLLCRLTT